MRSHGKRIEAQAAALAVIAEALVCIDGPSSEGSFIAL
jgi:hypothetical protein